MSYNFIPDSVKLKRGQVKQLTEAMLRGQDGMCPLCQTRIRPGQACLDHCHTTGHIRAVLCRNCNGIEGRIKDFAKRAKRGSTELSWVRRLVSYWELHKTPQTQYIHPSYNPGKQTRG